MPSNLLGFNNWFLSCLQEIMMMMPKKFPSTLSTIPEDLEPTLATTVCCFLLHLPFLTLKCSIPLRCLILKSSSLFKSLANRLRQPNAGIVAQESFSLSNPSGWTLRQFPGGLNSFVWNVCAILPRRRFKPHSSRIYMRSFMRGSRSIWSWYVVCHGSQSIC